MSKIKSEKAKDFIMSIVEPTPTPNGELIFYVEMTPLQVVEAIIIAETELTEHYEQQLQELRDECDKWRIAESESRVREGLAIKLANEKRVIAETIIGRAVEAFKSACSCGIEAGIGPKCERFIDCKRYKMFTQKLTENDTL